MVSRRTNKGQVIDLDAIMAQQKETTAMGNMGVDAEGNVLGPNGEIIEPRDQRVRAYYKDNPQSSTAQQSLKGNNPELSGKLTPDAITPEVKTAKTQKENVRTAPKPEAPAPTPEPKPEPEAPLGESFDEQEPLGFREVELPNGDIEMVPYYTEEDTPDGEDKSI
jgi:hypothetical protein